MRLGIGAGLQPQHDGSLLGLGTDYKVAFTDGQFMFTPMLGKAAPRDLPLAMQVTHTGRGELAAVGAAATERHELRVDVVRPELREQLDLRPEGMKQSFVFTQLPAGSGDLVVRTHITSELRPERAASDGAMRFTFPGVGGVEIGQVVGIDANGRRATGSLRCHGDTLDFVLPAAFVDSAAMPLVVDPMLTPLVFVVATTDDEGDPDVAHLGQPFNKYLIVWRRSVSATNHDIRAQGYVDQLNNSAGLLLSIEATSASADEPKIAAVSSSVSYVVTWSQAGDIMAMSITANGTLSAPLTIANGAAAQVDARIVGDALGGQPLAIVVWRDNPTDTIFARSVSLATSPPTLGVTTPLVVDPSPTERMAQPAVSRDCPASIFLLTYLIVDPATLASRLEGLVFSGNLTPVGSTFAIAGSPGTNAAHPAVAGDSNSYVVAYESTTAGVTNLECRTVRLGSGVVQIDPVHVLTPPGQVLTTPRCAWFGESVLIACARQNGAQNDVLLLSIDPFTCQTCESTLVVDTAGNGSAIALTSRFLHFPLSSEGVVVWVPIGVTSGGDLEAQRVLTQDGVTSLGIGGCMPGVVHTTCAKVGNSGFSVRLRNGPTNDLSFAVVSTGVLNFVCGPCTVVPDFSIGVIEFVGATSPLGDANYPLTIPNNPLLAGMTLAAQFAHFGTSCLGNFRLSRGVTFTIE